MGKKSREDYIRFIYFLYERQEDKTKGIKSVDVAKKLKISKPSVSAMLRQLLKEKLIVIKPYSNIFLTKKGLKEAKRITHDYRVIEVFLTKILNYNPEKITVEAHSLEHAFTGESVRRLDALVGNPRMCPHGAKIH